jgi:hypothetical protein
LTESPTDAISTTTPSGASGASPSAETASPTTRVRRENVRDKSKRLLLYGRVRVTKVDGDLIVAEVRGDSGRIYSCGFDPRNRQWRCQCEARGACSHLLAVQCVTAVNGAA